MVLLLGAKVVDGLFLIWQTLRSSMSDRGPPMYAMSSQTCAARCQLLAG